MPEPFVWLLVIHVSVMGVSGRGLPDGERYSKAFAHESDCRALIAPLRRSIERKAVGFTVTAIECERKDIKR